MKNAIAIALFASIIALGADITGTWKGTAETPNGSMERTFMFKQDGAKLAGETSSQFLGKSELQDGKVEGDSVSFTIVAKVQDNEMKLKYTGKVNGSEIKFHVENDQGLKLDYTVKKQ